MRIETWNAARPMLVPCRLGLCEAGFRVQSILRKRGTLHRLRALMDSFNASQ